MLAAPTTKVVKITGITIIFSKRTNRSPRGEIHRIDSPKISPTIAPKIKPIKILINRFDLKYQSKVPFFPSALITLLPPIKIYENSFVCRYAATETAKIAVFGYFLNSDTTIELRESAAVNAP